MNWGILSARQGRVAGDQPHKHSPSQNRQEAKNTAVFSHSRAMPSCSKFRLRHHGHQEPGKLPQCQRALQHQRDPPAAGPENPGNLQTPEGAGQLAEGGGWLSGNPKFSERKSGRTTPPELVQQEAGTQLVKPLCTLQPSTLARDAGIRHGLVSGQRQGGRGPEHQPVSRTVPEEGPGREGRSRTPSATMPPHLFTLSTRCWRCEPGGGDRGERSRDGARATSRS